MSDNTLHMDKETLARLCIPEINRETLFIRVPYKEVMTSDREIVRLNRYTGFPENMILGYDAKNNKCYIYDPTA